MSPTAAIVILFADRSRSGGGAGGNVTAGSGATSAADGARVCSIISGSGVAQPAIIDMARVNATSDGLFTEPDSQYINICLPELTANQIETIEIIDRTNTDAVIGFVIYRNTLNDGLDTE